MQKLPGSAYDKINKLAIRENKNVNSPKLSDSRNLHLAKISDTTDN